MYEQDDDADSSLRRRRQRRRLYDVNKRTSYRVVHFGGFNEAKDLRCIDNAVMRSVRGFVFIGRQRIITLDTNLGESRRYLSKIMPRGVKKENLPSKICVTCNRPFSWRKKREKCRGSETLLAYYYVDRVLQYGLQKPFRY